MIVWGDKVMICVMEFYSINFLLISDLGNNIKTK